MRTFLQSFLMAMARSRHVNLSLWYSRTGSRNMKSVMFKICLSLWLWRNTPHHSFNMFTQAQLVGEFGMLIPQMLKHMQLLYHYPKYAIVIGPTRVTWYVGLQIITVDQCSAIPGNMIHASRATWPAGRYPMHSRLIFGRYIRHINYIFCAA